MRFTLENVQPIVVIGGGGHAKVIVEAIRAARGTVLGVLDPHPSSETVLGARVLGDDDELERLRGEGVSHAFVALGQNGLRAKIGARVRSCGFLLPVVVHPAAHISQSATLGSGTVVMAGAVVGVEAVVGDLAIVNTGAIIDHDNKIGDAAHVAPGCALAGGVIVGARAFVGVGSSVRPDVQIGADVIIGAGSTVVADVADGLTVVGTPAKPLKRMMS